MMGTGFLKLASLRRTVVRSTSIGPLDLKWLDPSRPTDAMSHIAVGLGTILVAGAFGYVAGRIGEAQDATFAHASGACIAMELAAAHGAVDEHERRMILRSLTSAINPYFGKFPERSSDISGACDALTKGAVSGNAARSHSR